MRNRSQREIKGKRDTAIIRSPAQPKETGGEDYGEQLEGAPAYGVGCGGNL